MMKEFWICVIQMKSYSGNLLRRQNFSENIDEKAENIKNQIDKSIVRI